MVLADAHPNQAERLQILHSYDILDTPSESDFDDIVNLASRLCETPISLISLVDADRQWFKAKVGMEPDETGMDQSICAHAILENEFFEINDTSNDPRTADNPLVADDPNVRFYAGAPLLGPNGLPIGTLCVLDNKPRELNDLQRETLRVLAAQVMKILELRQAIRDQEVLRSEMDHRVKNSLQTVASFVRLYGREVQDENARQALDAIQRRIDAVGALHEQLQSASTANQVDMGKFLHRVCHSLGASAPENIKIDLDSGPFLVSSDRASAVGVIVSEFVANSIKHAFPGGSDGTVKIELERAEDGALALNCADNGVGSSQQTACPSRLDGLGQGLVAASASQLNGELTHFLTEQGSRLTLVF